MVVFGLVLIAAGALVLLAALFTITGSGELIGLDLANLTIYFVGLATGLAFWFGLSFTRRGTKRTLKLRKERKELSRLSEKLDRVEAERRDDGESDAEPEN